jgi:hypothetical protein
MQNDGKDELGRTHAGVLDQEILFEEISDAELEIAATGGTTRR